MKHKADMSFDSLESCFNLAALLEQKCDSSEQFRTSKADLVKANGVILQKLSILYLLYYYFLSQLY